MTVELDRFELLREGFLQNRASTDDEADLFVSQLASLVEENPSSTTTKKRAKTRNLQLERARAAVHRARHALGALDASQVFIILRGKMSTVRKLLPLFDSVNDLACQLEVGLTAPIDIDFESRAMTITIGIRQIFRIFDLQVSESESSFAAWCLGEVFEAAGIDATPESVRSYLRRTAELGRRLV